MNRTEIMNSISLKKRFCKDYNLPITVFDNPYFYERLCTLDVMFNCVDMFEDFCIELEKFNTEQEYFTYYNEVKESVINYIKSNESYIRFSNENVLIDTEYPKKNLYVEDNDNKTFISLDMKKANFSALHHYSATIFKNRATWEDFMKDFTSCAHIIYSKYIRQVIMGACNPGKQIKYEKYLMSQLAKHLVEAIPTLNIYSLNEDEIIINIEDGGYCLNDLYDALEKHPIDKYIKLTMFDLTKIKGTDGWMKSVYDFNANSDAEDIIEFKCLNAAIFHQVLKHYYNEPITSSDLVFYHNGQLAAYLKEVNNPWEI